MPSIFFPELVLAMFCCASKFVVLFVILVYEGRKQEFLGNIMTFQTRRLLSLMLHDEEGDSSQRTEGSNLRGSGNVRREWKDDIVRFLIDLCADKYWEYDRKPFKQSN